MLSIIKQNASFCVINLPIRNSIPGQKQWRPWDKEGGVQFISLRGKGPIHCGSEERKGGKEMGRERGGQETENERERERKKRNTG